MTVFMVERSLKGISMDDLGAAQKAAIAKAAAMRDEGANVDYIRTTFAPADGRCMCLFQADSKGEIERLNTEAGIPFDSVTEALDLTPQ